MDEIYEIHEQEEIEEDYFLESEKTLDFSD